MHPKELAKCAVSYMPGLYGLARRLTSTGGSDSARYCYSVWLRHLVMLQRNGLPTWFESVAEPGPGDSLGIGLCALLCGATRYAALDVAVYANPARNLQVFEELVGLFRQRAPIPDDAELPEVYPRLPDYRFPADILDDARLDAALAPARLDMIRQALAHAGSTGAVRPAPADTGNGAIHITYAAPWYAPDIVQPASVDLLYSQAVLEHVDDLAGAYRAMVAWLRPGGVLSHVIDYRSHGITRAWNGHWRYSHLVWQLAVRGRRLYLINREPHSRHLALLRACGCEVVCDMRVSDSTGIGRQQVAPAFRTLSESDLTTSTAFMQAVRRAS